jgi:hypothetical protein
VATRSTMDRWPWRRQSSPELWPAAAPVIGDSLGQRRKVDKGPGVLIGSEVWQWGEQFIGVKGRGGQRSGKRNGGSVELLQCR